MFALIFDCVLACPSSCQFLLKKFGDPTRPPRYSDVLGPYMAAFGQVWSYIPELASTLTPWMCITPTPATHKWSSENLGWYVLIRHGLVMIDRLMYLQLSISHQPCIYIYTVYIILHHGILHGMIPMIFHRPWIKNVIDQPITEFLLGDLEHVFHIFGTVIPIDLHIFQRGSNYQPDLDINYQLSYIIIYDHLLPIISIFQRGLNPHINLSIITLWLFVT